MEQTSHHVIGDRDRTSAAYIGRPSNGALVAAVSNRSAARETARVDVIAEDPPQRLHKPAWRAAIAASGVVMRHTLGMWRITSPGAKL